MNVYQSRKSLTYALNAVGFTSVATSGEIGLFWVPVFLFSLIASWWWEPPRVHHKRWAPLWTAATIGAFVYGVAAVALFGQYFLAAALDFILFLAATKLFQRAAHRDYVQSLALSLLLLVAGAALSIGMVFALLFIIYVALAVPAMTSHHLYVELDTHAKARAPKTKLDGSVLRATLSVAFFVMVGSASFFFLFPRMGFGFFGQPGRSAVETSGFSESVELGGHGTIRDDQTIVMRVEFDDGPPTLPDLIHWRGMSLDRWDGRTWSDTDDERVAIDSTDTGFRSPRATHDDHRAHIYLENLATDVLFTVGPFQSVDLPHLATHLDQSFMGRRFIVDRTGEVSFQRSQESGLDYIIPTSWRDADATLQAAGPWPRGAADLEDLIDRAYAEVRVPLPGPAEVDPRIAAIQQDERMEAELRATMPDWRYLAETYLAVEDDDISPRMRAYAAELRAEHPEAAAFTLALRDRLRQMTYSTTLEAPESADTNVIDAFLFEWQSGHCEYYATAMTLLLRIEGIPARIVNGYLGAEYNDVGEYYVIRQSRAHSWVEAYFPGVGWVELDPTPGGALVVAEQSFLMRLQYLVDSARLMWLKWVIEYDLETQFSLARDAYAAMGGDTSSDAEAPQSIRQAAIWLLQRARSLGSMLFFGFVALVALGRRTARQLPWDVVDWAIVVTFGALNLLSVYLYWPRQPGVGVALAVLLPTLLGWSSWRVRRWLASAPDGPTRARVGRETLSALYLGLLRTLEDEGVPIHVGSTAADVAAAVQLEPATEAALDAFLGAYGRVRFGGEELSREAWRGWRRDARQLRRSIRRELRAQAAAAAAEGATKSD